MIAKTVKFAVPDKEIIVDQRSLKRKSTKRFRSSIYIKCKKCNNYSKNGNCEECVEQTEDNRNARLINIPIRQQIKYYLRKYYREIIKYLFQHKDRDDGSMYDLYD